MFTIEKLGRKNIQFYGFLANALFLGVLAGCFNRLKTQPAAFVVVFALLQLSFNFGPNTTTFIVPAEIFPTRVRGAAHGFSAACGKVVSQEPLEQPSFAHATRLPLGSNHLSFSFCRTPKVGRYTRRALDLLR